MDFGQFLGTIILGKIFSPVYQKAAQTMCQECENFIEKGSKILDLGCGRGIVADTLKNYFDCQVFGVDIEDRRVVKNFPFEIIDGKNLPFKDNTFSAVFISYVLHHTQDPEKLLEKAKRVTRNKIIIYEDLPEGIFGKVGNLLHQITYNPIFQSKNQFLNFKKEKDWQEIFTNLRLKILFKKEAETRFNWIYPHKSILFVLEKED